ncbi:MAG: PDZ domain-containing protein [Acidobacteria bacterium]|nr:PDZ domain-containing protein [Acidobacteriota bacterium]
MSNVRPGSAAEKAGVKRGDIITAVNGDKIDDGNVLRNKVAGTLPGTEIKLTILRDGTSQDLTATLDEFDTETSSVALMQNNENNAPERSAPGGKLGLTLQPITPQIAKQFGSGTETEGLVVLEVDPNGVAADAGISRGDFLLEVNRQPVTTPEAVESALQNAGAKPVLLLVSRKGSTIFMTVRPR